MNDFTRKGWVNRILSGRLRLRLHEGRSCRTYWLRGPGSHERHEASELASDAYAEAALRGVPTATETLEFMKSCGLWSDEEDKLVATLQTNLETLKIKLYQNRYRSVERETARKYIDTTRRELNNLLVKKGTYDHLTCEGHAGMVELRFLVGVCLLHGDGKTPVYFDGFRDCDCPILDEAVSAYLSARPTEEVIRELARTEPWRGVWVCRHSEGQVFGKPACELTDEQRGLTVWSRVYDNAYESQECPDEEIIGDDDSFDGWLLLQKRNAKAESGGNNSDALGSEKIRNSGEVFVVADGDDAVRRINDLNSEHSSAIKAKRLQMVQERGAVHEAEMPDSKQKILQQFMARMTGR